MQITKIHGSNYNKTSQKQSFKGIIKGTTAFTDTVYRTLVGQAETVSPAIKMLEKLKKKLPQSTTVEIAEIDYDRARQGFYKVKGSLSAGDYEEPLEMSLRTKEETPATFVNFTRYLVQRFSSTFIGAEFPALTTKIENSAFQDNRKVFFAEILNASKRLDAQRNAQKEGTRLDKAQFITDEVTAK